MSLATTPASGRRGRGGNPRHRLEGDGVPGLARPVDAWLFLRRGSKPSTSSRSTSSPAAPDAPFYGLSTEFSRRRGRGSRRPFLSMTSTPRQATGRLRGRGRDPGDGVRPSSSSRWRRSACRSRSASGTRSMPCGRSSRARSCPASSTRLLARRRRLGGPRPARDSSSTTTAPASSR